METVPRDGSLQLGLAHDGIALTVVCPQCVLARPNRDPCKTRKKLGRGTGSFYESSANQDQTDPSLAL